MGGGRAAMTRILPDSAELRRQTFCSFHRPRLNSTALHTVSTENEMGTAMKMPVGPNPSGLASTQASGTWPSQKQKKLRRVGVQVSPAPLKAASRHMPAAYNGNARLTTHRARVPY